MDPLPLNRLLADLSGFGPSLAVSLRPLRNAPVPVLTPEFNEMGLCVWALINAPPCCSALPKMEAGVGEGGTLLEGLGEPPRAPCRLGAW